MVGPAIYRSAISDHLRHYRGEIRIAAQSNHIADARSLLADLIPDGLLIISGESVDSMISEIKQLRRIDLDTNIVWWALHGDAVEFQIQLGELANVVAWQSDASGILDGLGAPARKPTASQPSPKLTAQEHLILQLAAEGLSNRSIAFRLGISESTVKNHLRHIGAKFNTSSRAQAVWQAVQCGYLTPIGVSFPSISMTGT
ncbi:MAG: hypothetical protein RL038_337 [Actinomycetota bacterium]